MSCCLCETNKVVKAFTTLDGVAYVKCCRCGLIYQRPKMKVEYEDSFWQSAIDPDGQFRNLSTEREDKLKNWYKDDIKFVDNLPIKDNYIRGRILDVGCGLGFFLSALNPTWFKFGVEPSEFAANFVRSNFPEIRLFQGILPEAHFEDKFFDVVYLSHVIEHIDKPRDMIKEIYRVLKPNGILIIGTPNIESFCARRFKGNYRLLGSAHIAMWSKSTLYMLLRPFNLHIFKTSYLFFGTKYFTLKNLLRMFDTSKVSPPFYGNIMTVYARKIAN